MHLLVIENEIISRLETRKYFISVIQSLVGVIVQFFITKSQSAKNQFLDYFFLCWSSIYYEKAF